MTSDRDPFFDPPDDSQLLGKAAVYLSALFYLVEVEENVPIIDYKGKCNGELMIKVHFDVDVDKLLDEVSPADPDSDVTLRNFLDRVMPLAVHVKGARGLPANLCADVFVRYKWWLDKKMCESVKCSGRHMNPAVDYEMRKDKLVITDEFVDWLERGYIDVEVWGSASNAADASFAQGSAVGSDLTGASASEHAIAQATAAANERIRQLEGVIAAERAESRRQLEAVMADADREKAKLLAMLKQKDDAMRSQMQAVRKRARSVVEKFESTGQIDVGDIDEAKTMSAEPKPGEEHKNESKACCVQ